MACSEGGGGFAPLNAQPGFEDVNFRKKYNPPEPPPPKRSKFANFKGRDRDWAEIERKEQELIRQMAEGG